MAGRTSALHSPSSRATSAPSVGALVPGVLARLGLAEGVERWRAVLEWEAIVGESLALHSRAVRVDGDVLVVETDDPYGLSHSKIGLLKLVREHIGADRISDLRLVLKRN
jgi:predicted nucleic acid-binding Zn ribbon protein